MGASGQVMILSGVLIGALGFIVFYSWKAARYIFSGTKDLLKGGEIESDRSRP